MGEVYLAKDSRLGRDVALKILPESFRNQSDRLQRFTQEMRAVAALNHPNILAVFDVGGRGLCRLWLIWALPISLMTSRSRLPSLLKDAARILTLSTVSSDCWRRMASSIGGGALMHTTLCRVRCVATTRTPCVPTCGCWDYPFFGKVGASLAG